MSGTREPPPNMRSLDKRIDNQADKIGRPRRRLQRAVANTVIGQMLPPGVVKGGTAMKLRVGEAGSRFTPDLDAAHSGRVSLEDYINELDTNLAAGWGGFTGRVIELDAPSPERVPDEYVMRPFDIKLDYQGRSWLTVRFELGHDEIGSTATHELRMASDIVELFEILGLEPPAPIPVLAIEHQVAQKLHACTAIGTTGRNERAHDLVDLQLLDSEEAIDMAAVGATAERLFAARRGHAWPPEVVTFEGWDTLYAEAADGLDVLPTIDEAVSWAHEFIARATSSK